MRALGSLLAFVMALACGAAVAEPSSGVPVQVELGPAVKARMFDLGRSELTEEARFLKSDVERRLAREPSPPISVRLTIVDIEPNRPTATQLGDSAQLQLSSFGVGGAAVIGEVVMADGRRLPVRHRFFQNDLRFETNLTTWGDAEQAFDELADGIAAGRPPDDAGAWPPPHTARVLTGTRIQH